MRSETNSLQRPLDMSIASRERFLNRRSKEFAQLLLLEADNPRLFEAKLPVSAVPYWMLVRFLVARLIGDALFGTRTAHQTGPRGDLLSTAKFVGRSVLSNPWRARRSRSRILMCNSAIANARKASGYFNRLSDYFAELYPQITTLLEIPHGRRYYFPRTYPHTYCLAGAQMVARACSAMARVSTGEETKIRAFLELLEAQFRQFIGEEHWPLLQSMLRSHVRADAWASRVYGNLLDRLQPAVLLMEDASYGHRGVLITLAKQRGIHVAEYQHGLVSCNHEAYNYLPKTFPKVRDFLPDTFLAYGGYWKDQVSLPCAVRIIGNPHLTESMGMRSGVSNASPTVMLVAGALNPLLYQRVMLRFLECAPNDWTVVLRPHPSLRSTVARDYPLFVCNPRIRIDLSDDYYSSLRNVDVVAGDASTAVMEAAAFNKRVFLIDHPEVERNYPGMFPTFSEGDELFAAVSGRHKNATLPHIAEIWAPNWQGAYRDFIEDILTREGAS
jgi:hypothetical protein